MSNFLNESPRIAVVASGSDRGGLCFSFLMADVSIATHGADRRLKLAEVYSSKYAVISRI